jgi:hypothetical protein
VTTQDVALVAESLIDQAIELKSIGGVYGNQRPTHFLCLLLKLLQIQPEKEILVEYLQAEEFKYVTSIYSLVSYTSLTSLQQIPASTRSTICAHDIPGG